MWHERDKAGKRTRHIRQFRNVDTHPQAFTLMFHPVPREHFHSYPNEYKYHIPNTGPKDDPVLRVIGKAIGTLNKKHMDVAAIGLYAINLTAARLWPPEAAKKVDKKLYAFKYGREEVPITVGVRVIPETISLTADRIQIRTPGGSWMMVNDWIVHQAAQWNWMDPTETMRKWWSKNGKQFPLMKLPAEIRYEIYRHAMGGNLYPDVDAQDGHPNSGKPFISTRFLRISFTDKVNHYFGWTVRWAAKVNRNIFLASRKVKQDAESAVWTGTTKRFTDPFVLENCVNAPLPPHVNWLSSIHLNMTLFQYFRIFQVQVDPSLRFGSSDDHVFDSIHALLPALKELELFVDCPRKLPGVQTSQYNPWKTFKETTTLGQTQHRHMKTKPCFKVAVDWLLMGAFPYIKDVPRVKLMGAVKTSLKEKWGHILAKAYAERKVEEKDRTFNWEEEAKDLISQGHVITQPPRCSCPASCVQWQYGVHKFDADDSGLDPFNDYHWD